MESRFELLVEVVSDEARTEYEKTFDPATGLFSGILVPTREYLDTFGQDSIDITFEVSDVRKLDGKRSSYSKTISLPDTAHNRSVFDSISQLGYVKGFNPKRATKCYVLVDTLLVFSGYLQLQEYVFDGINGPSYNVILTSSLRSFKTSITDLLVQDLPWGDIDEYWDYQHVMDSWNPSINKEVFYPLIDYGWNLKTQLLGGLFGADYGGPAGSLINSVGASVFTENFYPAVYLKSIVDRIFIRSGFSYRSDFFNSELFRSLIIPYTGGKEMQRYDVDDSGIASFATDKYFSVGRDNDYELFAGSPVASTTDYMAIKMNDDTGGSFLNDNGIYDITNGWYKNPRTDVYQQKFILDFRYYIKRISDGSTINLFDPSTWPSAGVYDTVSISVLFCRKSSDFTTDSDIGDSQIEYFLKKPLGDLHPEFPYEYGTLSPGSGNLGVRVVIETLIKNESYHDYGMDTLQPSQIEAVATNDRVRWMLKIEWDAIGGAVPAIRISEDRASTAKNEVSLNVIYGEKIDIGGVVPQNIKCYDFLSNLMNVFNLYVEADPEDDSIFIIEPRPDFIEGDNIWDWSDKVDLTKNIQMKILAETQNKFTNFQWKDGNEWVNKNYKVRSGYSYGEYTYNSVNDYATGSTAISPPFGATPSIILSGGEDPNYPDIIVDGSVGIILPNFSEDILTPVYPGFPNADFKQSSMRILFAVKRMNCVFSLIDAYRQYFYFGIRGYGYETTGTTPTPGGFPAGYSGVMEWYPYAGTLDDLYEPTFDMNWGSPKSLYYSLDNGRTYPQDNLVTEYWWDYLEQLNAKDSRILTLTMKLTANDIAEFSFRDRIFIRINTPRLSFASGAYFTVNRISGYNPSTNDPCTVELLLLGNVGVIPSSGTPTGAGGGSAGAGIPAPPPDA